jgi:hypothetical protein
LCPAVNKQINVDKKKRNIKKIPQNFNRLNKTIIVTSGEKYKKIYANQIVKKEKTFLKEFLRKVSNLKYLP